MQDDEFSWVQDAQKGDRTALSLLLQRHYGFLLHYLVKVTMHPSLAEDLAQETMLKAIEKIGLYDIRQSKFSSWLMTIGTRLYLDSLRRMKRERVWKVQEQAVRKLRWQAEHGGNDWPEILDALSELSEELRVPIVLKHYYGYSYEEISTILDIPAGTVKSRIYNGLKSLRKETD